MRMVIAHPGLWNSLLGGTGIISHITGPTRRPLLSPHPLEGTTRALSLL